jgi:hypothetical protein
MAQNASVGRAGAFGTVNEGLPQKIAKIKGSVAGKAMRG